jgi:drug/metabolite transporter (DMT)-like permease
MTFNPLVAGVGAALLLGEPFTPVIAAGLVAVFAGIWIATTGV